MLVSKYIKKMVGLVILLLGGCFCYAQTLQLGLPIGHLSRINSVNFSPKNAYAITASEDNSVKIWDINTSKVISTLDYHTNGVNYACFNSSGTRILTCSNDNIAIVWDINTLQPLHFLTGHTSRISKAIFTKDDSKIITWADDETVKIWNTDDGSLLFSLAGHKGDINHISTNTDESRLITSSCDQTISEWDLNTGSRLKTIEIKQGWILKTSYSKNQRLSVSLNRSKTISICDLTQSKVISTLTSKTGYTAFFVHPITGELFTSEEDGTVTRLEIPSGKILMQYQSSKSFISGIYLNNASNQFATIHKGGKIAFWDINKSDPQFEISDLDEVTCLAFSRDGSQTMFADESKTVTVINSAQGSEIITLSSLLSMPNAIYPINNDAIILQTDKQNWHQINWHTGVPKKDFTFNSTLSNFGSKNSEQVHYAVQPSSNILEVIDAKTKSILYKIELPPNFRATDITLSSDQKKLYVSSEQGSLLIANRKSQNTYKQIQAHTTAINQINLNSNNDLLVTCSNDKTAKIWNSKTGKLLHTLNKYDVSNTVKALFSYSGKYLLTLSEDGTLNVWNTNSGDFLYTFSRLCYQLNSDMIDPSETKIIAPGFNGQLIEWNINTGKIVATYSHHEDWINSVRYNRDGTEIISTSFDKKICIWSTSTGELIQEFNNHTSAVSDAVYIGNQNLISASRDGSVCLANTQNPALNVKLFILENDPVKWVHLAANGFFDASPEAMDLMYWTMGTEIIDFAQLKDRFWVPNLWEKTVNGELLPQTTDIRNIALQPQINLESIANNILPITIKKREGGYGEIALFINGKEITSDIRGTKFDTTLAEQKIEFDLADHPYLTNGNNTITIKAKSADGFVQGRGVNIDYYFEPKTTDSIDLFAVIVGVGDYQNKAINLKYSEPDAEAMTNAITLGGKNLYNERTHIYTFTSKTELKPTKTNIKHRLDSIAKKAGCEDVLFIYLSGHGITRSGIEDDFYFLTSEAKSTLSEAYNDPVIRANTTISTSELIDWIKPIAAGKRLMIIDACGSGKAVEKLLTSRSIDASQIKAIDRMQNRMGTFLISGCAADAVSYEANEYGQGLLTYSILQGLKGAALKDGKYADVASIFNHAKDQVPLLAKGVGGIQEPQMLINKSGSFDFGIFTEEDKNQIDLAAPKPIFVRSSFLNKKTLHDNLNMSYAVDEALSNLANSTLATLLFYDVRTFPTAYSINGVYKKGIFKFKMKLSIINKEDEVKFTISGKTAEELSTLILSKVKEVIN